MLRILNDRSRRKEEAFTVPSDPRRCRGRREEQNEPRGSERPGPEERCQGITVLRREEQGDLEEDCRIRLGWKPSVVEQKKGARGRDRPPY